MAALAASARWAKSADRMDGAISIKMHYSRRGSEAILASAPIQCPSRQTPSRKLISGRATTDGLHGSRQRSFSLLSPGFSPDIAPGVVPLGRPLLSPALGDRVGQMRLICEGHQSEGHILAAGASPQRRVTNLPRRDPAPGTRRPHHAIRRVHQFSYPAAITSANAPTVGTSRSGLALINLVAAACFPCRRFTHTVAMPSDCAGTTSWYKLSATCRSLSLDIGKRASRVPKFDSDGL